MPRLDPTSTTEPRHDPGASNGASAPADALKDAVKQLGELKTYAAHFVAAKVDGIKVSVRSLGVYAVLGIVGLIAGAAVIATSVVLLLLGAALGLSALLGTGLWSGSLIVGGVMLGLLAGGIVWGMKRLTRTARQRLE